MGTAQFFKIRIAEQNPKQMIIGRLTILRSFYHLDRANNRTSDFKAHVDSFVVQRV